MSILKTKDQILNAVKLLGGTIIAVGAILFLFGIFVDGYNYLLLSGTGVMMGGVFLFLMGVFFVATEEMFDKINRREDRAVAPKKGRR
jgi:hypothetical protein